MAAKGQNTAPSLPQPFLAKLWWATLPALIATQGVVSAAIASPEHFWSFNEDNNETHRRFLQKAVQPDDLHEHMARHPTQVDQDTIDFDWFATEQQQASGRFQVSAEITHTCCDPQDCHFEPGKNSADDPQQRYLCNRETVQKVVAAASAICSADSCDASVSACDPCTGESKTTIASTYYSKNDAGPAKFVARAPFSANGASCPLCESQASYAFVSSQQASPILSREVFTPAVSTIPYADEQQVLLASGATSVCPRCTSAAIPLILGSAAATHFSLPGFNEADSELLHWQILFSDASALSETIILGTDRIDSKSRHIPYLLCEGCDVTTAHPTAEQGQPTAANSFLVVGNGRESDDLITRAEEPGSLDAITHLQYPLASRQGVALENSYEEPTSLWLSASGSIHSQYGTAENDCLGAECEHKIGPLTEGHPTAAWVAFDGTDYNTIDDINHISSLACTELSPADPRLYCEKEVVTAPVSNAALVETLDHASHTFLALAKEVSVPLNSEEPSTIARSAPDTKAWGSVKKLSLPSSKKKEVVAEQSQTAKQSQEIPNFWSVLDKLIESREPASQLASLPKHAVVAGANVLSGGTEVLAAAPKFAALSPLKGSNPFVQPESPALATREERPLATVLKGARQNEIIQLASTPQAIPENVRTHPPRSQLAPIFEAAGHFSGLMAATVAGEQRQNDLHTASGHQAQYGSTTSEANRPYNIVAASLPGELQLTDGQSLTGSSADLKDPTVMWSALADATKPLGIVATSSPQNAEADDAQPIIGSADSLNAPAFLSPKFMPGQPWHLAAASSPEELDVAISQTTIGSSGEPSADACLTALERCNQFATASLPLGPNGDVTPKSIGSAENPNGPAYLSPMPQADSVHRIAAASMPANEDLSEPPSMMGSAEEPRLPGQIVPLPALLTASHLAAPLPQGDLTDKRMRSMGSAEEASQYQGEDAQRSLIATANATAQVDGEESKASRTIGDAEPVPGSCKGPGQGVIACYDDSSSLRAFAQPGTDGRTALLTFEEAEALGLIAPGAGKDGSLADKLALNISHVETAAKTVEAVTPVLGGNLHAFCKQAAPTDLAGGQANAPLCGLRQYPQTDILGQTQRSVFDATQVKQMSASAQPKDLGGLANRKAHPLLWAMSPGPGHQFVTADGKVPGGLDIDSGRIGRQNAPDNDSLASQIRSLQGGYYYYIGEGTGTSLSTSKDHLQVSGMLSRLPGTASELHGVEVDAERVGLYDDKASVVSQSVIQLAPNLDGAMLSKGNSGKVKTSVSLAAQDQQGLSGAMGRSELRTGKQKPAFAKVVDTTVPPKSLTQAGRTREGNLAPSASQDAAHRFAVEVVPHVDTSASPSMHLLVGQASPLRSQPTVKRETSIFMDFAHASEMHHNSIGYEPNAFLSVGATSEDSYTDDAYDLDDEDDETYSVGAVTRHQAPEEVADLFVELEDPNLRTSPGVDSNYRQSNAMGVRREGLLWDNNQPWLSESNEEVVWIDKQMRPPDRARGNPIASAEASANAEVREMDISLQKKNRTTASEDEQPQEGPSSLHEDDSTDISSAPLSESSVEASSETAESASPAVAGWEQPTPVGNLNPAPSGRDLDLRRALDKTVAQDTLFESGTPGKIQEKTTPTLKDKPVTVKDEEPEPEGLLINFRDVGMTEYVRFVAQQTGKNFLFNDEDLQFNITIISEQPTSLDNIMAALLQELRIHGLQVIEQGNNIIIHKNDKTRGPTRVIKDEKDNHETQLVTRVFQLNSIPAIKMKEVVVPMLSAQALVQVLSDTNNLLITDFGENVSKIGDLIHSLDMPSTAYEIGQYVGRNNFIENLIPLAEEIIRPFTDKQSLVFVPHLSTNSVFIVSTPLLVKRTLGIFQHLDSLEGSTKILTLEDLSKGGAALTQQVEDEEKEVKSPEKMKQEELDAQVRAQARKDERYSGGPKDLLPSGKNVEHEEVPHAAPIHQVMPEDHISHTKFYIHKLQYRRGDQLQDALSRISDSLRLSEKANIDLVNAIYSIQWIESSNSLVVTGTADALGRVKELIEEIDVPLRQILLEMLILDTTISDSLTYAVDFTSEFSGTQVAGVDGFSGGQPTTGGTTPLIAAVNTAAATSTSATTGLTSAANAMISAASLVGVSTPGFNLGVIGRRILRGGTFFNTMGALVQALHGDTNSEIVLNPKIIVEDNNEAEIFVGETIAFQTQNVVNDTGTIVSQNVEYRDVGTRLKVRPQIGNNNIVTLEIEEEVSQTAQQASGGTSGGNSSGSANVSPGPTTSTSRTITKVHVPNEFFVVLSGMIRDEKNRSRNQVPCLGGLPIIGAFSSRKDNSYSKRNLMIFIRPQIIDTDWDFDDITRTQQNIYKDKRRMKPRWKYEADEGLDFLNLPRINERCEDDNYLPGYTNEMAPSCPYYPTNR